MPLTVGDACPEFSIDAVVSGRTISSADLPKSVVIVIHGPKTTDAPKEVGKAVRAKWPNASDVTVVNIVDLRKMGGMWRKVAEAQMKATYEKLASKIGDDAPDYVLICPDWDGSVCETLGVPEPDRKAGLLAIKDGSILAALEGGDLASASAALALT